jgi:hypothetical protein
MTKRWILTVIALSFLAGVALAQTATETEEPTQTPTDTPEPTETHTPAPSPTNTPTNTIPNSPTRTPTITQTSAPTFSHTSTRSPTRTPTFTFTNSPTRTPTPTQTRTHTAAVPATATTTPTPTCPPANDRRGRPNLTLCNAPCLSTPTPMAFGTPVPAFNDLFGRVKTGTCQSTGTAQVQFFCYAHAGPWQGTPIPVTTPISCPGSATWEGTFELCFGKVSSCAGSATTNAWVDRLPDAVAPVAP